MSDKHERELNDALLQAAKDGNLAKVTSLLEQKADPNYMPKEGYGPLHVAAENGHTNVVLKLLEQKVGVSTTTQIPVPPYSPNCYSALHLASLAGKLDTAKALIGKGAPVDEAFGSTSNVTPLMLACRNGHYKVAEFLVTQGANCNALADMERTRRPLFAALSGIQERGTANNLWNSRRDENLIKLLLTHGADPDAKDHKGRTPLKFAEAYELAGMVKILKNPPRKIEEAKHSASSSSTVKTTSEPSKQTNAVLPQSLLQKPEDSKNHSDSSSPANEPPIQTKTGSLSTGEKAGLILAVGTVTAVTGWLTRLDKQVMNHATKSQQALLNIGFGTAAMALCLFIVWAASKYVPKESQETSNYQQLGGPS